MKTALALMLLATSPLALAQAQWEPLLEDTKPTPLFGTQDTPRGFVPPRLSPSSNGGVSTYYNADTHTFGTVGEMGDGRYVINENHGERLIICMKELNGSVTCN